MTINGPIYHSVKDYNPFYRSSSDIALEYALKAEAKARTALNTAEKAQETANYARGLQKDLDDRTRGMEKRIATVEAAHNALVDRVAALEPKPAPAFTPIFTDVALAKQMLLVMAGKLGCFPSFNPCVMCAKDHIEYLQQAAEGTKDNNRVRMHIEMLDIDLIHMKESDEISQIFPLTLNELRRNLRTLTSLVPPLTPPKPPEPTAAEILDRATKAYYNVKPVLEKYRFETSLLEWFVLQIEKARKTL